MKNSKHYINLNKKPDWIIIFEILKQCSQSILCWLLIITCMKYFLCHTHHCLYYYAGSDRSALAISTAR